MSNITEYLEDFAKELGKEGYSIIKAGVKTFYKSIGELAAYTIDNYMNTRFEIRLEDFAFEQDNLRKDQKEYFYKNIDAKQLNFLFELLDKARISAYDLHAKILSKIFANLIKNGELNYYESALLANISSLNEVDFIALHKALKKNIEISISERCIWGKDDGASLYELIGIKKFIKIGIINEDAGLYPNISGEMKSVNFIKNEYSDEI